MPASQQSLLINFFFAFVFSVYFQIVFSSSKNIFPSEHFYNYASNKFKEDRSFAFHVMRRRRRERRALSACQNQLIYRTLCVSHMQGDEIGKSPSFFPNYLQRNSQFQALLLPLPKYTVGGGNSKSSRNGTISRKSSGFFLAFFAERRKLSRGKTVTYGAYHLAKPRKKEMWHSSFLHAFFPLIDLQKKPHVRQNFVTHSLFPPHTKEVKKNSKHFDRPRLIPRHARTRFSRIHISRHTFTASFEHAFSFYLRRGRQVREKKSLFSSRCCCCCCCCWGDETTFIFPPLSLTCC